MYDYEVGEDGKVMTKETPWIVEDDEGVKVHSLMAPAVLLSFIKQLSNALEL